MPVSTRIYKLATNFFIIFNCDDCGHKIAKDIEFTNWYSTDASEAEIVTDKKIIECDNCGKKFTFSTISRENYTQINIDGLPNGHPVTIYDGTSNYDELQAISSNTSFFETFKNEINNLKTINQISLNDNYNYKKILNRLVFIAVISTMETYLKDALINTVLPSENFLRKFVETFKDFKEEKFTFNKFFECQNKIKKKCEEAMVVLLYHDIPKIKGIYKAALDIDFGDISTITKYVSTRHHLVHRNGKTKEGKHVIVDEKSITDLIKYMETFIGNINNQIAKIKI
jgi:hypothetical protein